MSNNVVVGIDIGGTNAKGALVSGDGRIIERIELPTDPQAGTKSIIAVAEGLVAVAARSGLQVLAIGVGAAGFTDHARGAVTFSPNLVYDDPEIKIALEARLGLPTSVENDANAAAWAEYRFGAAAGTRHLATVTLGTGIGSGFVIDGVLLRGATGAGAELGHIVVAPDGPACPCGLRGCLERYASGGGIAEAARRAVEKDPHSPMLAYAGSRSLLTAREVVQAAADMDATALEILRRAGRMLGIGLSNVVNLFDPDVIVLAGTVVRAGEAFLGPARDHLSKATAAQRRRPVRLDVSSLGDNDAGIIGAAALAYDDLKENGA